MYTARCAYGMRGSNDGHGPSRLVAAGAKRALGYRPPRQPYFTATESAPTGVERLTEHANMSKRTFYPHFSG
jgi:hypothetical protein